MSWWRVLNDWLFNLGLRRQRSTEQQMEDLGRSLERELSIDYGAPRPIDEPTPAELAARARRLFNAGRRP